MDDYSSTHPVPQDPDNLHSCSRLNSTPNRGHLRPPAYVLIALVLGACQQVRVEGAIVRLQVPLGAA